MRTILVALRDVTLRDQVRAAIRSFPGLRTVATPRERLLDILREPGVADALIVDHERGRNGQDPFIAEIREVDRAIAILAVGDLPDRQHFNRAKMDLDVFSFLPLPLDGFDLLRRLHRLVASLPARA